MKRIYLREEIPDTSCKHENWTAIIPAAGRGSRLGYSRPKVLYPILGRPILEWLMESLIASVTKVVWVVSPEGRSEIENELNARSSGTPFGIAVQQSPLGMGDAVLQAQPLVDTLHCVVLWGDQVTVSPRTVQLTQALHESRTNAKLTLPTIWQRDPYIHFERAESGRIVRVLQARSAPILLESGENDCGLFAFRTSTLFALLQEAAERHRNQSSHEELDLLPLFPFLDQEPGELACWRLDDPGQALGVNALEDAGKAEDLLCQRLKTNSMS